MVAAQYPEDFRLARTPSQWQQGSTQSQHRLLLPPKSRPRKVRAGLHCQVQCMFDTYQQNLSANFGHKKSVYIGPQKRRHSYCAFPASSSTPARQGDIVTETSIFQDRCSVPESSKKDSQPLSKALLKETPPECKESPWSSLLYQPVVPIDLQTNTTLAFQRHCKGQEVKNTLLQSPNPGWSSIQNMNQSGGSHSNLFNHDPPDMDTFQRTLKAFVELRVKEIRSKQAEKERCASSNIAANQLPAVAAKAVEENHSKGSGTYAEPVPEAQEAACCPTSASEKKSTGTFVSAVGTFKLGSVTESTERVSLGSDLDPQKHLNVTYAGKTDGRLGYGESFPWNMDNSNLFTSTENPQFWRKDAATCKRDLNSPTTVTTEVPLDESTRGQPKSSLHFSSQEENQPSLLTVKTSNDTDQIPGVSRTLKHTTKKDELERCIQPVGTEQFINLHGAANVPEELQTKMGSEEKTFKPRTLCNTRGSNKENIQDQQQCHILEGDVIPRFKSKTPVDEIKISDVRGSFSAVPIIHSEQLGKRSKCEQFSEDACSDLSIALLKNKVMEETGQLEGIGKKAFHTETIRNPEYEDISDDGEMKGLAEEAFVTKPRYNPQYEDISNDSQMDVMGEEASAIKTVHSPQYDNISDDEYELQPAAKLPNTHTEDSSLSTASETAAMERPPQIHEPNDELFFEKEGFANLQDQDLIKPKITFNQQKMVTPKTDLYMADCNTHSVLNESDGEKHSVLGSYAVLRNEKELHDQIVEDDDEEDEDDWIVIPLEMLDLRFDTESENQEDLKTVQCSKDESYTLGSKSASVSPEIQVFETVDSFVQATDVQILNKFDVGLYWSSPEHDTDFEEETKLPQNSKEQFSENEEYDTEDSCDYPSDSKRNHLTVSNKLVMSNSVHLTSKTDFASQKEGGDEVISVQNCQTTNSQSWKEKLKRRLYKVKSSDQQKTCREKHLGKTDSLPLDADSDGESDQRMRKKRSFTSASENTEDASCSQQKQDTQLLLMEDSGLLETSTKSKRNRKNNLKNTMILDSESEDDSDKNCKMKPEKTFFSSNYKEQGEPSFADQTRPLHSKSCCEEISEPIQDSFCDQPVETSVDFEAVQPRMSRQKILNNYTIVLDSDSEDETEGGENSKKEKRNTSHYSDSEYEVQPSCSAQQQQAEPGPNEEQADSVIILLSDSDDDDMSSKNKNETRSNTAQSPGCPSGPAGLDSGKPNLPDADSYEVIQHNTYGQTVAEDSYEVRNIHSSKRPANTERFFPSCSEDSDDETSVAKNDTHSPETTTADVVTNIGARRQSYKESTKKQHHSADGNTESPTDPTSLIPRAFVSNLGGILKLQRKDTSPKSTTTPSEVYKKNEQYSKRTKVQQNAVKPQLFSRQSSLPNGVGQKFAKSLSSTSGSLTESRRSSVPINPLPLAIESRETTNPHHLKSKHSAFTQGLSSSATQYSDGRKKVTDIWTKGYIDIPDRRRRAGEDTVRPRNDSLRDERSGRSHNESLNELRPEPSPNDLLREARQQPSSRDFLKETRLESRHRKRRLRQTHSPQETAAPLMKKSRGDYLLVPKPSDREPAREPSGIVGENYKWFEKRVPKKGPSRDGKL